MMSDTVGLTNSSGDDSVPALALVRQYHKTLERRPRTNFTTENIHLLNAAFSENQYPDYETRQRLAEMLHVPESRIAVWFQNKRTRMRKQYG